MPLVNRKTARDQLYQLLLATGVYQAGYKSERKSFGGQSPVFTIHSDRAQRAKIFDGTRDQAFHFLITHWIKRSGPGAAGEDSVEDMLDDLEFGVAQVCDANVSLPGFWEGLYYDETGTQPVYHVIDGEQYRGEVIPVAATMEQ